MTGYAGTGSSQSMWCPVSQASGEVFARRRWAANSGMATRSRTQRPTGPGSGR